MSQFSALQNDEKAHLGILLGNFIKSKDLKKKKQREHHQEMLASLLGFTNHNNVWIHFCQKTQKSDIGFTL